MVRQLIEAGLLLLPFALVCLLGKPTVAWCLRHGMVADHTDDRRIHATPTPHGGGVLLPLVGVPLGMLTVWYFQVPYGTFLFALLAASVMVAAVGYLDDKHELSARARLGVHLLAVGIGLYFLPPMFDSFPLWLDKLILLLAWGWFVNLYNFMDGADGLACSEGVFIAIAVALLVAPFKPLALVVAGVSLGFLSVNWQPAKVFLGDVGSTWLGYVLGGLLLVACADDTWRIVWPLATVTLAFTGDATWTLVRRVAGGHKPWEPHRTFWFHRVLALGYSHSQLAARMTGLNLMLLAVALVGVALNREAWTLPAGLAVAGFVAWRIKSLEKSVYGA